MTRINNGPQWSHRQRGAALLILVAVVGLAASSLLVSALGHNNLEARRQQRTARLLAEANEALLGYATAYGRLPRPAASATDGRENQQACRGSAACTGFLPWVTLGVAGVDAWGKLLRYTVTPALTDYSFTAASAIATKTVQQRGAAGQLDYLAGQAPCTLQLQCAPFVVLSQGKNNFGTSAAGLELANAGLGNDDEILNNEATDHFVLRVATDDADSIGGPFDDQLAWIPLATLYQRMRAARTLP